MSDLLSPTPVKLKPIKTGDVRAALSRRFCAPEWALLFEVRDAAGYNASRSADALAMSLWPSRGLELHGMEIKISRSDWLRERAKPEKAEKIAAYCDYWWLVTAPGVVLDINEIAPAWGWYEFDGDKLHVRKPAAKTEASVCDRSFLAALLRRVDRMDSDMVAAEVARRMEAEREVFDAKVQSAVEGRLRDRDKLRESVEAFEKAAGIDIGRYGDWSHSSEERGRAFRAILNSGVDASWNGLHSLAGTLREIADKIDKAMDDIGLPRRPEANKKGGGQ